MSRPREPMPARLLEIVVLGVALSYVAAYLLLAAGRLTHPYELEWMEGGSVDHVARVLSGAPLYVEPSLEFTPFIYTPLYYLVCAAPAAVLGPGFLPLRLVSILASIGCLVVLFAFVRRETRSTAAALLAPGLFAATYRVGGAWLDIARVDSLFLLLLLASVYLVRHHRSGAQLAAAAVLAALAFLTKQSALPVAAFLCVYSVWCLPRRTRFVFPATCLGLVLASTLLLDLASGGWYSYYVLRLPAGHRIVGERIAEFWLVDMRHVSIALLLAITYIARLALRRRKSELVFSVCLLTGTVATSWVARVHAGGWVNVMLPVYAALAILFAIGVADLMPAASRWAARVDARPPGLAPAFGARIVAAACLAQFLVLAYDPRQQLPDAADVRAGDAFVELLREVDGDVFVPFHGHLPALAGKRTYAQGMALEDVFRGADEQTKQRLRREISAAIRDRRFGAVVLDHDRWDLLREVEQSYAWSRRVFSDDDVFWPVTGLRTRPEVIFTTGRRAAASD